MATHTENVLLLCFTRLVGYLDEQGAIRRDDFADSLDAYAATYGDEFEGGMRQVAGMVRSRRAPVLQAIEGGKTDGDG